MKSSLCAVAQKLTVVDEIVLGHADTSVTDGDGAGLLVSNNPDLKLLHNRPHLSMFALEGGKKSRNDCMLMHQE